MLLIYYTLLIYQQLIVHQPDKYSSTQFISMEKLVGLPIIIKIHLFMWENKYFSSIKGNLINFSHKNRPSKS